MKAPSGWGEGTQYIVLSKQHSHKEHPGICPIPRLQSGCTVGSTQDNRDMGGKIPAGQAGGPISSGYLEEESRHRPGR